jgi:predicted secreted Zn-dependent protease
MEANVIAEFVPEKSWVKAEPSENLLRHEQGHFDITEIYARKLRRHFERNPQLCAKGQAAVDAEAKKIFAEWDATQDQYDLETNHSKNIPVQREWETRIQHDLKELELWAAE